MTELIDLASRAVGGGVVAASDETFAEKENLVTAAAPTHAAHTFGHKGQVYDGWETRRRRDDLGPDGDDWAVVRLGLPGIVHRVVVDTAFFDGNHPVSADVDTCWIEGHPAPDEVVAGPWERLCGAELQGDTAHTVEAEVPRAATHVRLRIHPDGGVARLRVLGAVLPDVRRWRGIGVDLASLAAGGRVLDASNRHYSPPENLLLPRSATTMGEGWETRRHRRARRRPGRVARPGPDRAARPGARDRPGLGHAPGDGPGTPRRRDGRAPRRPPGGRGAVARLPRRGVGGRARRAGDRAGPRRVPPARARVRGGGPRRGRRPPRLSGGHGRRPTAA